MRRTGHRLAYVPTNENVRINPNSPQAQGLAGAWPFWASRYASVIPDLAGQNHAVPSNTNYGWQETDNELGTGVFVDGWEAQTFDCGNDASLQVTANGLTVVIWVRLYQNVGSTNYPGLIGKGDADSTPNGSYLLYFTNGNHLNYFHWSGGARKNTLTGAVTFNYQATYMFAASWIPSTRVSIYTNGLVDATTTTTVPATLDNPAYNFLIGSNQGGASKTKYPFRGMIHEARLYNTFKTDDEIWQMWNPPTRYDLYRSPIRYFGKSIPGAATGRVFGPAAQTF